MRLHRFENWVLRHSGSFIAVSMVMLVALGGVVVFTLVRELGVEKKIGPKVEVVGPCRTFGPDHPECRRQSRLIITSCILHSLHPACVYLARVLEENRQGNHPDDNEGGGNEQTGPPPSGLGGPPSGGSVGPGNGAGGDNNSGGGSPPPSAPSDDPLITVPELPDLPVELPVDDVCDAADRVLNLC